MKRFVRPLFLADLVNEELWLMDYASLEIADRWHESVWETLDYIEANPLFGRLRKDLAFPSVRSWGVKRFRRWIIFYEVRDDAIVFLRVVSGTMNLVRLRFD